MSMNSKLFDFSAYSVAAASYFLAPSTANFVNSSLCGVQAFALSSIFDRAVRRAFVQNANGQQPSARMTLLDPLIEEAMYSGILLTQTNAWIVPRFFAALCTGTTAARALTSEQNKQGITLDTKIGFIWAVSRELLLTTVPEPSIPLIALDSCVFALAEVCPKGQHPGLSKFGRGWSYKVISSAFFRATANTVASSHGISASITQHLLFNISRGFQKEIIPA